MLQWSEPKQHNSDVLSIPSGWRVGSSVKPNRMTGADRSRVTGIVESLWHSKSALAERVRFSRACSAIQERLLEFMISCNRKFCMTNWLVGQNFLVSDGDNYLLASQYNLQCSMVWADDDLSQPV